MMMMMMFASSGAKKVLPSTTKWHRVTTRSSITGCGGGGGGGAVLLLQKKKQQQRLLFLSSAAAHHQPESAVPQDDMRRQQEEEEDAGMAAASSSSSSSVAATHTSALKALVSSLMIASLPQSAFSISSSRPRRPRAPFVPAAAAWRSSSPPPPSPHQTLAASAAVERAAASAASAGGCAMEIPYDDDYDDTDDGRLLDSSSSSSSSSSSTTASQQMAPSSVSSATAQQQQQQPAVFVPTPEQPFPRLYKHPIVSRIVKNLNDRNHQLAMDAFYEIMQINNEYNNKQKDAVESATADGVVATTTTTTGETEEGALLQPTDDTMPIEIPPGIAKGLFRMVCPRRPFDVYQVLLYFLSLKTTSEYHAADGDINAYARMYERACNSLRYLDPIKHAKQDCETLVRSIVATVQRFDRAGQELCCPTLVSALVEQKSFRLGTAFCGPLYWHLVEQQFTVPDGYWVHLLSHSRYNRQGDLPFADVLMRVVDAGRRPRPVVVLNALDNLFPFTDISAVSQALKAILRLQQQVVEAAAAAAASGNNVQKWYKRSNDNNDGGVDLSRDQYYVDIRTLEIIGATSANQGQSDVNLLIWDMLDILGYEPTVGIYENTVAAFAMNTFTYREAFTVLAEMEARGFAPSRALIRSFSIHLRDNDKHLDFAFDQLKQLRQEGKPVTTAALNAIMAGAAERGDIDRILSLMQEYDRNDIEVDADTFSFAFESLGKNLRRRTKNPGTQDHMNACLVAAESFLTMMEDRDIEPTLHIIHDYVELLCMVGQVETATTIALEASGETELIGSKTIYRVAMANAKLRQFEIARQVAACEKGEPMPFLVASIDREERLVLSANQQKLAAAAAATVETTAETSEQQAADEKQPPESPSPPVPSFWKCQS